MKLSDWLLATYNVVACTSGWLCSCLLSLGCFDWYSNWFFIFRQLVPWSLFHLLLLDVWPWDYFDLMLYLFPWDLAIYCVALSPTVIVFVVLIKILLSLPFLLCLTSSSSSSSPPFYVEDKNQVSIRLLLFSSPFGHVDHVVGKESSRSFDGHFEEIKRIKLKAESTASSFSSSPPPPYVEDKNQVSIRLLLFSSPFGHINALDVLFWFASTTNKLTVLT